MVCRGPQCAGNAMLRHAPHEGNVEIGWHLMRTPWHQGYATGLLKHSSPMRSSAFACRVWWP